MCCKNNKILYKFAVAPFAGAWIEILKKNGIIKGTKVAPFAGAWLKDGREGTVVYVGKEPPGYLIELSDKEGEVVEVSPEQVKEIIYRA